MIIKQVTDMGRNWARFGLDKSRAALETSADRLRATADMLGTWSSKLSSPRTGDPEASINPSAESAGSQPQQSESTQTH